MVPKVETVDDVVAAEQALLRAGATHLPLHVLIESPAAVHRAFDIAAHSRVQSLSFGLMDFVSQFSTATLLDHHTHPSNGAVPSNDTPMHLDVRMIHSNSRFVRTVAGRPPFIGAYKN